METELFGRSIVWSIFINLVMSLINFRTVNSQAIANLCIRQYTTNMSNRYKLRKMNTTKKENKFENLGQEKKRDLYEEFLNYLALSQIITFFWD